MLHFEPYSPEALKKALPYIRQSPYPCSDVSAGMLFMWQEGADVRLCVWHDTFLIREDYGDQNAFSWPYGADPDGMLRELAAYARENSLAMRFFAVSPGLLEEIRADGRFGSVSAACDPRWSDYLYSFEDAATFRGRKFSGQRNHINRFVRRYGEPAVRFLRAEDVPRVQAMLSAYEQEHPDGNALERMELRKTRELLLHTEELDLPAACLTVGEEIAAFSIGEIIGDTLIIHVEKALKRFEGAYPAMYRGFVRLVWEKLGHPLRLVNREDDSGDPGLRISKRQYQPVGLVDKYLVRLDSPAAALEAVPVLRAGKVVLTPFREEDKAAYLRLNTDAENNRWWGYDYRKDMKITGPVDENTFFDAVRFDMRVGDSVNFAIRLEEDGGMIGEVLLWRFTLAGTAELGCRLFPQYQGRGYGRAAFSAAADFAGDALGQKTRARCFLENAASRRMIEASGFRCVRQDDVYYYFERPE